MHKIEIPDSTIDQWNGLTRHRFQIEHCPAWIVEPANPAPGRQWVWCMEFPDAFIHRTGALQLLDSGVYYAHIQVGNTFGCPDAISDFDAFYSNMQKRGFSPKPALIGLSRGGLYAYNWAARNPNKVGCIYADAPVCDFKSWPAGKGKGVGSPSDWQALLQCYHFSSESQAIAWKSNPIDNLAPLAAAQIPILHVVGDVDDVVPVAENSDIVESHYRELGGSIQVIHKPLVGHHPHGLDDPTAVVEFILGNLTA